MVEQVLVGCEDTVGEPVVTDELPDVFDRVQFGAFGRQGHEGDVGRNDEVMREMPSGLVEEENGMPAWAGRGGNLAQVQVHGFGIAGRRAGGGTLSFPGAEGTENVDRGGRA